MRGRRWNLFQTEDLWSIWLGLGIVALVMAVFWAGSSLKGVAVTPGKWSDLSELWGDLQAKWLDYPLIYAGLAVVLSASMRWMGTPIRVFLPGFTGLYFGALVVFYVAGSSRSR